MMAEKKQWILDHPDEAKKELDTMQRKFKPIPADYWAFREGRCCKNCRRFDDSEATREMIIKSGFWEKAFTQFGDGSDWKPHHFGELSQYGVCLHDGAVTSRWHPTCGNFRKTGLFARLYRGIVQEK